MRKTSWMKHKQSTPSSADTNKMEQNSYQNSLTIEIAFQEWSSTEM